MARGDPTVPKDISALVGKKYRFVVSISSKSFMPDAEVTSFQVIRIDVPMEKTASSTVLYRKADSFGTSASHAESLPAGTGGSSPSGLPIGSFSTDTGAFSPLAIPSGSVPAGSIAGDHSTKVWLTMLCLLHKLLMFFAV